MMIKRIWKDIKGWEGKYQVSNLGDIKSFYGRKERILNPSKNKSCMQVGLSNYKEGILQTIKVHRLVALAFIPNPNNYPKINHIDNDFTNNKVSNLEWCTQAQNIAHCVKQNRNITGEKSHLSKLSKDQVIWVRDQWRDKKVKQKDMAKALNVDATTISKLIKGHSWNNLK